MRRFARLAALSLPIFSSLPLALALLPSVGSAGEGGGADSLELVASVDPVEAAIPVPRAFRLTLTNPTQETLSFVVGGCPVVYRIDGAFSPDWACPALARRIEIAPGETISFGPEEDERLLFQPSLFPLAPGKHQVVLGVEGVGRERAEFVVEPPQPDVSFAAGRVLDLDGQPVGGGIVVLSRAATAADPASQPWVDQHRTRVSPRGYFLFSGVSPGRYRLRVETAGAVTWYPGTADPNQAQILVLEPGGHHGGLDWFLPREPTPHPRTYPIDGIVFEAGETGESRPLEKAVALAIPVTYEARDTSRDLESLLAEDPGARGVWGIRLAHTDPDGRFRLETPAGTYRLLAGKLASHGYQYWDHVRTLGEAQPILVPDPTTVIRLPFRFDLPRLGSLARMAGRVLVADPTTAGLLEPLAGAEVIAHPILPSGEAVTAPHRTRTEEDGSFVFEVPADTPYLILARAPGHRPQFYRGAGHPEGAEWVDVVPGETRGDVDFLLRPVRPPEGRGAIEGIVYRRLPDRECRATARNACVLPAAGAVIRVIPAFPTSAPLEIRTRAGRNGRFRVDGLPAEAEGGLLYFVSAELPGYGRVFFPGGVPYPEAEPLRVLPGRTPDAGRILLTPREDPEEVGFVLGVVRDSEGNPVPRARIRVYQEPGTPRGRVRSGRTDARGEFHIPGIPPTARVLLSAEASGFAPVYYPDAYRWQRAEPVPVGGPNVRIAPVEVTLAPNLSGGPYLQAGRVGIAPELEPETGPRALGLSPASRPHVLPGAFFYLAHADAFGPEPPVAAGGVTGDDGSVLLLGLPEGNYVVFADRPGFEPAYFRAQGSGGPTIIRLDPQTPAVLADIALEPVSAGSEPEDQEGPVRVTDLYNVPNPFRPRTALHYRLLEDPSPVTVQVFDYRGRLVRTLLEEQIQSPGPHRLPWDGTDEDGRRVSSGVYFFRVRAGKYSTSQKMVLLP